MKIQWHGNDSFTLSNKENTVNFNPTKPTQGTFSVLSKPGETMDQSGDKVFDLPGEFEVNGILAQGFYSDDQSNVVHKVVMDGTGFVFFGNLASMPKSEFFEQLGENTDVIMINLSDNFDDKLAKNLIQQVTPRMAILGGDSKYFPALVENLSAKTVENNPHPISGLSDDNTEVVILPL